MQMEIDIFQNSAPVIYASPIEEIQHYFDQKSCERFHETCMWNHKGIQWQLVTSGNAYQNEGPATFGIKIPFLFM